MGRHSALALATAAYTLCFAGWTLIGALAPQISASFRLSATQTGVLVALPVLVGCIGRIPVGILADRWGGLKVFVALLLLLVPPTALLGFAASYSALLALGGWLGLAGAAFSAGIPFVVARYPPRMHGLVLGIYGLGNGGAALANWLAPAAATTLGWRPVFPAFALTFLAMALVFWAAGREAAPVVPGPGWRRLLQVATRPRAWALVLYALVTFGGFLALSVHLPSMLTRIYRLSPAEAGGHAAWFAALATFARPAGGWLADRFGGSRIILLVFPAVAATAGLLALDVAHGYAVGLLLALAAIMGAGTGAIFKLVADDFPRDTGTVSGLVGAFSALGGVALPLIQSYMLDRTGRYVFGYVTLTGLALAAMLVDRLQASRGRASERA